MVRRVRRQARARPRMCSRPRGVDSCSQAPAACCVRSAASSRSASCGDKILGTVRGTAPAARSRDRLEPPCRRVDRPRGTGLTCTGVSPRATRHAYKPDTNDGRLAIVRADSPDSRSVSRTTVRSPRRTQRSDRHQGYLVRGSRCCEACQHRKRSPLSRPECAHSCDERLPCCSGKHGIYCQPHAR